MKKTTIDGVQFYSITIGEYRSEKLKRVLKRLFSRFYKWRSIILVAGLTAIAINGSIYA